MARSSTLPPLPPEFVGAAVVAGCGRPEIDIGWLCEGRFEFRDGADVNPVVDVVVVVDMVFERGLIDRGLSISGICAMRIRRLEGGMSCFVVHLLHGSIAFVLQGWVKFV